MSKREQIEFRLREYERRESQLNDEGMITLGTLRLALRALDTERDAALGAKVRAWVASNGGAEYLRQHSMDVSVTSFAVARLCDVIAAHLREEQKGGSDAES